MKKLLVVFMLLLITVFSYGNTKNYEVKAGEVELEIKTEMFGMKNDIKSIIYFDNFGEIEASRMITNGDYLGIAENLDLTNLKIGNKNYLLNNLTKTYSYLGEEEYEEEEYDFEDYKKLAKEKILGKECDVLYLEDSEEEGIFQHKIWLWKGLILKSESLMEAEGFKMLTNIIATKINIGNINKSYFEIPKDYKEEQ